MAQTTKQEWLDYMAALKSYCETDLKAWILSQSAENFDGSNPPPPPPKPGHGG